MNVLPSTKLLRNMPLLRTLAAALLCCLAATPALAQQAAGFVFQDRNANGSRDTGERGLPGIRVSNGQEIVKTDSAGRYTLPVTDDTTLFVIKPRGWKTPVDTDNLPRFYYTHKPAGSPVSKFAGVAPTGPLPSEVSFGLQPQEEPDSFRMLVFGDTQPRGKREVSFLAQDIGEVVGFNSAFGVTLGDVVFDDLTMFEYVNRVLGRIGVPWYSALGNHDLNFDAKNDELSDESFERVYGPPYYSFDYGPVHFIVMDTVLWSGPDAENPRGRYRGGIDARQLEFIKNDIADVPRDHLVVLFMHYPLVSSDQNYSLNIKERHDLYPLLEKHKVLSFSAHRHYQEEHFIDKKDGWNGAEPHHHIVQATVCGSWWRGFPDGTGIPHSTMADGGPKGYSVVTFDKNRYSIRFKVTQRPDDYQMKIEIADYIESDKTGETDLVVNVFAGNDRTRVEYRADGGEWRPLERTVVQDPALVQLREQLEKLPQENRRAYGMPGPVPSLHIWSGKLPANLTPGGHVLTVRAHDMYGQTWQSNRILVVEESRGVE